MVKIERVLESEEAAAVGVHGSGVFDYIDVFRGPAGGYVGYYCLLQDPPVACEADKEGGFFWNMRFWGQVPGGDWRESTFSGGIGGEGKVVDDYEGRFGGGWFVFGMF